MERNERNKVMNRKEYYPNGNLKYDYNYKDGNLHGNSEGGMKMGNWCMITILKMDYYMGISEGGMKMEN